MNLLAIKVNKRGNQGIHMGRVNGRWVVALHARSDYGDVIGSRFVTCSNKFHSKTYIKESAYYLCMHIHAE